MNIENIRAGLYWCRLPVYDQDDEKWDCIAIVSGERPFLNFSIFSVFFERMLEDSHTETSIVWGPRIEEPGKVEISTPDRCHACYSREFVSEVDLCSNCFQKVDQEK